MQYIQIVRKIIWHDLSSRAQWSSSSLSLPYQPVAENPSFTMCQALHAVRGPYMAWSSRGHMCKLFIIAFVSGRGWAMYWWSLI